MQNDIWQIRFLGNTFSATADCREVLEHKKVAVVPGMAKWVQWKLVKAVYSECPKKIEVTTAWMVSSY